MRPLIVEEPYSKAALLSRRLAVFSLAVAVLGILGVGRGRDLLAVLGGAVVIAIGAVLSALLALSISIAAASRMRATPIKSDPRTNE